MRNITFFMVFAYSIFCLFTGAGYSDEVIKLKTPIVEIHSKFYYELLNKALIDAGFKAEFEILKISGNRAKYLLDTDEPIIFYMVESEERNRKYSSVNVGLTNGLIGHRVLLIPMGDGPIYAGVKNLDDFRKLNKVNGSGAKWFGTRVWELNNLRSYKHKGDHRRLFKMVAGRNRGIDYYATGFNEARGELAEYSSMGIELEKRLMFIYDRDYHFYLSKGAAKYKDKLEIALKAAKNTGLINYMVRKHWESSFEELGFDGRTKINLKTPE